MSEPYIFHSEAAKRFEERATALRERLDPAPSGPVMERDPLLSDVYVAAEFGPNDIRGPILNRFKDKNRSEVGRVVVRDGVAKGLRGDAHTEFLALAETIRRAPSFRDSVAQSTLREWLWDWLIDNEGTTLVGLLTDRLETEVVPHRILIPIYELLVPGNLGLGDVTLVTVSPAVLDELDAFEAANAPASQDASRLQAHQERRRKNLQGKAAALVEVTAELQYARDYALDQTEIALGILRLASQGMAVARSRSYCTVLGGEAVQTRQTFRLHGDALRPDQSWIASPLPQQWALEPDLLKNATFPLLLPWYKLVAPGVNRTQFQDAALKAALIYSRATLQESLGEKLLHAFSALESVLLRSDSEPISFSLADRMAFLAEPVAEKRQEKAKLVRTVYGYRSRFVHHAEEIAAEPEELDKIEQFMVHGMLSLRALTVASLEGGTRDECLDQLDARKYA